MNLESIIMSKPDVDNMEQFIEKQSQALAQYLIQKGRDLDMISKILEEVVRGYPV